MNTEYQIEYRTHNTYEQNVREAFFSFLVLPCTTQSQTVLSHSYANSLEAEVFHHLNPFGFEVASLHSLEPFQDFTFEMKAVVEKEEAALPFAAVLSVEEEQQVLASHDFFLLHHLFLNQTPYTSLDETYVSGLLFRKQDQTVFDYLMQLNAFLYKLLAFDPVPTNVCTTVNDLLKIGRGVCQDYTHLFLAIARRQKIPCRYVSGYLNQTLDLSGTAVMHAWAEAFLPGFGWQGFDPTNNLLADVHYIKTSHGSDYSDCSPLKGLLMTNGKQNTDYSVKVIPRPMAEAEG